jgi:hypothetical protein
MKELSDMLWLLAKAGETDTMSAAKMCEVEEELLRLDEDKVELLAVTTTTSMQQVSTAVEDYSAYRVPISLKVARQYTEELEKKIQENWLAMQRHLEPTAAMIRDLTAMYISTHAVQINLHTFFRPVPRPDSDSCVSAAGGKAN